MMMLHILFLVGFACLSPLGKWHSVHLLYLVRERVRVWLRRYIVLVKGMHGKGVL